jgi:hypothetical protein
MSEQAGSEYSGTGFQKRRGRPRGRSQESTELIETMYSTAAVMQPVTGLTMPEDISEEEWLGVGDILGRINHCNKWNLGEWLRFGDRKWGKTYNDAVNTIHPINTENENERSNKIRCL